MRLASIYLCLTETNGVISVKKGKKKKKKKKLAVETTNAEADNWIVCFVADFILP